MTQEHYIKKITIQDTRPDEGTAWDWIGNTGIEIPLDFISNRICFRHSLQFSRFYQMAEDRMKAATFVCIP